MRVKNTKKSGYEGVLRTSNLQFAIVLIILIPVSVIGQLVNDRFSFTADGNDALEIIIRVDAVELIVEPSEDDYNGNIKIRYDKRHYTGDYEFDREEGILEIYIDKRSLFDWDHDEGDRAPRLYIALPFEPTITLISRIKAGSVDMELGGLTIENADLELTAGEFSVEFTEPNRMVMSELDIKTKVGETTCRRLGNARAENIQLNSGIGSLYADFRGEQIDESRCKIDLDLGSTHIVLPEEVGIELDVTKMPIFSQASISPKLEERRGYYLSRDYENAKKRMKVKISQGIGELDIDYR